MQLDVKFVGGTQITVGLSALVAVRTAGYEIAKSMKIIGGAGTLWISPIVGNSLTGAQAGSLIVNGYPLASSEIVNIGGPATFYLAASSATMTVGLFVGYTSGYTSII